MKHSVQLQNMKILPSADDEEYYLNPDGIQVFTEQYLLNRGYCCGNGCRHCPYNYKAVSEPKRTQLLNKRKDSPNEESAS